MSGSELSNPAETREQAINRLSMADQRSVHILQVIQDYAWFAKAGNDVRLFSRNGEGALVPTSTAFSIKDFLIAVDFYSEHRASNARVNAEMMKPDGMVDVYSPHIPNEESQIVVSISNYMVPQILEFAYELVRAEQKQQPQNQ